MHDSETCNCRRGRERGCKMAGGRNIDSKFRDSHITGKHPSYGDSVTKALILTNSEYQRTKANTLMSLRHMGE